MFRKILSVSLTIVVAGVLGLFVHSLSSFSNSQTEQVATEQQVIKDVRIRKALSLAIDRNFIAEQIVKGEKAVTGLVPDGIKTSDGKNFRMVAGSHGLSNVANLAAAKKLLAEAGYPEGKGFPTLTLYYNSSYRHKAISESIQKMWLEGLGIESALVEDEWETFLDKRSEGRFGIARAGWIGDCPDPITYLELFTTKSEFNYGQYSNQAFDKALEKSKYLVGKKRDDQLIATEKILMNDAAIIPLYAYRDYFQVNDSIKNWQRQLDESYYFGSASSTNGILRWSIHEKPDTLDPSLSENVASANVINQMYEGLMRYDQTVLKPAVAKSYTVSPDGKTYTFKMRDNAKWSDGKAVTAHDFEYAWKRALDPKLNTGKGFNLFLLKGAKQYYDGLGPATAVGVKAVDAKTLKVDLVEPAPHFLTLTTTSNYMPIRKDIVTKKATGWAENHTLAVSNGPFKLKSYNSEGDMTLVANPYWWQSSIRKLAKIEIRVIEDAVDAVASFEMGEIDVNDLVGTDMVADLKGESTLKQAPNLGVYYYIFNFR